MIFIVSSIFAFQSPPQTGGNNLSPIAESSKITNETTVPSSPAIIPPSTPTVTNPPTNPPSLVPGIPKSSVVGAENKPAKNEITPELTKSVQRGLAFLASSQNDDGSFGRGRYGRHVGIAALAALAFMADGNLPGRGRYGEQVSHALEYVLNNKSESGLLAAESTTGPMYGHGFATLFLGEVYGMNPNDSRVRGDTTQFHMTQMFLSQFVR